MQGALEALQTQRGLEDTYYESITPGVAEFIDLRNKGRGLVLAGLSDGNTDMIENGLYLAELSVSSLAGLPKSSFKPEHMDLTYKRDLYASLGMAARMHAAVGDIDEALTFARHAIELTPPTTVYEYRLEPEDFGPVGSPLRTNAETDPNETFSRKCVFVDQYEVIFSGRLALILSASKDKDDVCTGRQVATRNWLIAPREQDPSRVAFPDNEKSNEERRDDQRKRMKESHVVVAGTRIPVRALREQVATRVCARQ